MVLHFLELIDTVAGVLKPFPDKLLGFKGLLRLWCGEQSCKKWELSSLFGQLSHACRLAALLIRSPKGTASLGVSESGISTLVGSLLEDTVADGPFHYWVHGSSSAGHQCG